MNFDSMTQLLMFFKNEVTNKMEVPTQFPNGKDTIEKDSVWCELSFDNEVRTLDGTRYDINNDDTYLCYGETGDFLITIYDIRGEGNGDTQITVDCLKEMFTDSEVGNVEFYQARVFPLVPVDEQYIMQVIAPYETSFEKIKEPVQ